MPWVRRPLGAVSVCRSVSKWQGRSLSIRPRWLKPFAAVEVWANSTWTLDTQSNLETR